MVPTTGNIDLLQDEHASAHALILEVLRQNPESTAKQIYSRLVNCRREFDELRYMIPTHREIVSECMRSRQIGRKFSGSETVYFLRREKNG